MSYCDSEKQLTEEESLLLENQVCFPLYSASNAVIRTYRPLLDSLDLTYSQYLVMMVLWESDGISVKDIGARLHLDSGTLTPVLKRLEAKGFVVRGRSELDERVRVLKLSEEGRELKAKALAIPAEMKCKIQLDLDELILLKSLCEKVMVKLEQ
ncbi:MarR family transcriptional regulator [Vibrio europaeus]|uniref:MarR family winged helix-turn-helix transcriptional regulator n=1 Tax=Vibrio europaeus TaxID=300876 RepID=UPI0018A798C8|nr:MarR family transcriptional regulator [Vibrio europaeus]MDC5807072.1 MarR family transcriptional regulator [Vibrio europaeus]MDC5809667.1 MarR family transcriptional regulator [Vibrio europaeus]MDC5827597.1 MarR family transcriptional regulator [Vibrio europaeus]MDC5830441.1 MarR family transcriptional regulator [Vibrio europaeus]MDC5837297.1 MarR family transcriptional regulator [Vibrio europaeus]